MNIKSLAFIGLFASLIGSACDTRTNPNTSTPGNNTGTNNTGTSTNNTGTSPTTTPPSTPPSDAATPTDRRENTTPPLGSEQGTGEADRRISADVRDAISRGTYSNNAESLTITTQNGVVTLRGMAADATERDSIITLARGVTGVKDVVSNIELSPRSP